ncbi:unnamed protein product [Allacma fusca]|uniref:Uncharacterized protein n=1 Tax=Allacma fusca TaxID=39272 RepID=A0A8J2KMJ5_9HEXA|nr:unnamed protein product [Allacma fusca]
MRLFNHMVPFFATVMFWMCRVLKAVATLVTDFVLPAICVFEIPQGLEVQLNQNQDAEKFFDALDYPAWENDNAVIPVLRNAYRKG